jgi:hypothetical protein
MHPYRSIASQGRATCFAATPVYTLVARELTNVVGR